MPDKCILDGYLLIKVGNSTGSDHGSGTVMIMMMMMTMVVIALAPRKFGTAPTI